MSSYTYKCSDCGKVFDIKATVQEKETGQGEKFACPKCQSKNLKQKFSAVNFFKNVFNGDKKDDGCCSGENCQPKKETDCGCQDEHKGCGCGG